MQHRRKSSKSEYPLTRTSGILTEICNTTPPRDPNDDDDDEDEDEEDEDQLDEPAVVREPDED
jgi:hypothetical protein